VATNLKDFVSTAGLRNLKILGPAAAFRGREDGQQWSEDPIHPQNVAYDLLAEMGSKLCAAAAATVVSAAAVAAVVAAARSERKEADVEATAAAEVAAVAGGTVVAAVKGAQPEGGEGGGNIDTRYRTRGKDHEGGDHHRIGEGAGRGRHHYSS
jgi:hypothetical protein